MDTLIFQVSEPGKIHGFFSLIWTGSVYKRKKKVTSDDVGVLCPVIIITSISLVFLIINGITKMFLKTMGKKKQKT